MQNEGGGAAFIYTITFLSVIIGPRRRRLWERVSGRGGMTDLTCRSPGPCEGRHSQFLALTHARTHARTNAHTHTHTFRSLLGRQERRWASSPAMKCA